MTRKEKRLRKEREERAAERIFGLLPEDQGKRFKRLWQEFEEQKTPEAKFARTMDNLQPMMLNHATDGKAWVEHGVFLDQILRRNENTHKARRLCGNMPGSISSGQVLRRGGSNPPGSKKGIAISWQVLTKQTSHD